MENIYFSIEDKEGEELYNVNEEINKEFINDTKRERGNSLFDQNFMLSNDSQYFKNTIKELLIICDYYGITKDYKLNKKTKTQIINIINDFEIDLSNREIVFKRKNLWFFMNELKGDKFMRKYILF